MNPLCGDGDGDGDVEGEGDVEDDGGVVAVVAAFSWISLLISRSNVKTYSQTQPKH